MKLTKRTLFTMALVVLMMIVMSVSTFAAEEGDTGLDVVVEPVVDLIKSLRAPVLSIVGAVGSLYCILLGVKYAKAEEPQDREKAKSHLKNAIIGFLLIFVLMLALALGMPAMIKWVNANS